MVPVYFIVLLFSLASAQRRGGDLANVGHGAGLSEDALTGSSLRGAGLGSSDLNAANSNRGSPAGLHQGYVPSGYERAGLSTGLSGHGSQAPVYDGSGLVGLRGQAGSPLAGLSDRQAVPSGLDVSVVGNDHNLMSEDDLLALSDLSSRRNRFYPSLSPQRPGSMRYRPRFPKRFGSRFPGMFRSGESSHVSNVDLGSGVESYGHPGETAVSYRGQGADSYSGLDSAVGSHSESSRGLSGLGAAGEGYHPLAGSANVGSGYGLGAEDALGSRSALGFNAGLGGLSGPGSPYYME